MLSQSSNHRAHAPHLGLLADKTDGGDPAGRGRSYWIEGESDTDADGGRPPPQGESKKKVDHLPVLHQYGAGVPPVTHPANPPNDERSHDANLQTTYPTGCQSKLLQALFGRYRHVLERRGEALLEAAMSLWEPYVASILRALDSMPGKAEVDLSLLVKIQ